MIELGFYWTNVFSDPNRPGMHMKLIKYLLKVRAPRLVYVSCNPATCARDLDYLCHGVVSPFLTTLYLVLLYTWLTYKLLYKNVFVPNVE